MGNLIFLVGAIGLSVVGSLLLWYRQHRPASHLDSVAEFQREMSALGSERPPVMRADATPHRTGRAVQGSTVHVRPGTPPTGNPGAANGGPAGTGAHDEVGPNGGDLTGGRR